MTKKILLCSASALMFCVSGGALAERPALPATHVRGEVHRIIAAVPGSVILYDQNDDDAGKAIASTNFTGDFDSFDSYGADDFTVPVGHKWIIREVEAAGSISGNEDPAETENVRFYKNKKSLPGTLIASCDNIKGIDNHGSFAIKLPKLCRVSLKGGEAYWISISVNMDFSSGAWAWETRSTQNDNPAVWENPSGGFGVCPNWEAMASCFGEGNQGPDFMFTLKGKDISTDIAQAKAD